MPVVHGLKRVALTDLAFPKDSARNNLDNFCRKCATDSVDFLFSKPQHSRLCEDFENKKWAEDVVQLRIRKSKLFLAES
jgi:hypothetical protein